MNVQNNNAERYKTKVFTVPNILSFLRICMIPLIVWLYCVCNDPIKAGALLILSGITDIADGFIARRFNMISDLGKIIDPVADKLTQASVLICLFTRFPLMICPFVILAAKENFMSVTGIAILRKTGTISSAKWHGKAATFLLYATMLIHIFLYNIPEVISAISVAACSAFIIVSFVLYGMDNIKQLKQK